MNRNEFTDAELIIHFIAGATVFEGKFNIPFNAEGRKRVV